MGQDIASTFSRCKGRKNQIIVLKIKVNSSFFFAAFGADAFYHKIHGMSFIAVRQTDGWRGNIFKAKYFIAFFAIEVGV